MRLQVSRRTTYRVFTLANPYRVVIDLKGAVFDPSLGDQGRGRGLARAYRFGMLARDRARLVLDAKGPIALRTRARRRRDGVFEITVTMRASSHAAFMAARAQARASPPPARKGRTLSDLGLRGPVGPDDRRPVVVIDPGHGGLDSGASGRSRDREKRITLAVGRWLAKALRRSNRYRVVMTRDRDVYVSLEDRVKLSRRMRARLFISLHADAIADTASAPLVRGATVYTLSAEASDARARDLAAKENASDILAGVETAREQERNQVRSILLDLLKRETSNFSVEFQQILVRALRKKVTVNRNPMRSAAFHVLKQTHTPSVLVELGYISNRLDARNLVSPRWQKRVAAAIRAAVDEYFARKLARNERR
ncbi:MAG: N-acetylmuramoyl-L-alanine amidase [Pseudomonadota bacterium]